MANRKRNIQMKFYVTEEEKQLIEQKMQQLPTLNYLWLWILCGLPFGLHRMFLWIIPGGSSFGGGIATFAFNFIIGGIIGGFVLVWRLLVAAWYVPLTAYRLIVG